MVSTIRGKLSKNRTIMDAVRACYPGGSMTGAPKLRTMKILESIENTSQRGIYSGSFGYFSTNENSDLNIIIRTVVFTPNGASIGAGGAITYLSDPEEEWEEVLIKMKSLAMSSSY